MQQGPYHSPVIDISSIAKLIAGTPVKQPHETLGGGKKMMGAEFALYV